MVQNALPVDQGNIRTNRYSTAISPALRDINDPILWHEVEKELIQLDKILRGEEKEDLPGMQILLEDIHKQ